VHFDFRNKRNFEMAVLVEKAEKAVNQAVDDQEQITQNTKQLGPSSFAFLLPFSTETRIIELIGAY